MRNAIAIFAIFGIIGRADLAFASMSSSNYIIRWDTLNAGGDDTSSSASYNLRDSIGETGLGLSSSTNFQLNGGYRAGVDDQLISFDLFSQLPATQIAVSGLSGTTVTVASTAAYSVGDFITVIQDQGASQVSAIGKVISLTGTTLTVDAFVNSGSTPVIDGVGDFISRLSGANADLGNLSLTSVATAIIGFNVTAAVDGGYTLQAAVDGTLRSGSIHLNDVTDGSVTARSDEYGGRSSDTVVAGSTFGSQDTAFSTSYQPIISKSSASFESRSFLTLKVGVGSSTANASYAQILSVIASPNF